MAGYTKRFLLDAFVERYRSLGMQVVDEMYAMAENYYDKVGKDRFRVAASLDASEIKKYKLVLDNK